MSTGSPLERLFAELANTLANASLRLDPRSRSRLQAIDGRRVDLVAELPAPIGPKTVSVRVVGDRLQVVPDPKDAPNAIARGSVADFLTWLASGGESPGNITLEGDEAALQEIADIFRGYAPDVATPLATLLGDNVANGLLSLGDAAVAALKSVAEGVGTSLRREAADHYATRDDLAAFLDALNDTRSRVDRLAARLHEAESRSHEHHEPHTSPRVPPETDS